MTGVIGGSGFYSLLENSRQTSVYTPYGNADVWIGEVDGKKVFFIPRHGLKHDRPPHKLNYKANIYALKSLGVKEGTIVTKDKDATETADGIRITLIPLWKWLLRL